MITKPAYPRRGLRRLFAGTAALALVAGSAPAIGQGNSENPFVTYTEQNQAAVSLYRALCLVELTGTPLGAIAESYCGGLLDISIAYLATILALTFLPDGQALIPAFPEIDQPLLDWVLADIPATEPEWVIEPDHAAVAIPGMIPLVTTSLRNAYDSLIRATISVSTERLQTLGITILPPDPAAGAGAAGAAGAAIGGGADAVVGPGGP